MTTRPHLTHAPDEYIYRQFERLALRLRIPALSLYVGLDVYDEAGKLIDSYHARAHTYVRNYYNIAFTLLACPNTSSGAFGAGSLSIKSVAGATATQTGSTPTSISAMLSHDGPANDAGHGIVLGTSNAAESFEAYHLTTIIANGNGAGQLAYSAQSKPAATYAAGTLTWTEVLTRIVNNNSGGAIVVAEQGIYSTCYAGGQNATPTMTERTLLGATVNIPNAAQATASYTQTCIFPN